MATSTSLSESSLRHLLEAPDYRAFMKRWLEFRSAERRFGYSDVARIGGFAARSFPRDVVAGQKRLTLLSLPKMIRGLGLPRDLGDYFQTLVQIEHEDCRAGARGPDLNRLDRLQARLKERLLSKTGLVVLKAEEAFQAAQLPEIYAALGSVKRGATVDDILARTMLARPAIQTLLQKMIDQGIAKRTGGRYYPATTHLNCEGLSQSEIFKKHFISNCERSAQIAKRNLASSEKLFLSSAFSVNRRDLPRLKEELRHLLLKYIDAAEQSDGDQVVNLIASLF